MRTMILGLLLATGVAGAAAATERTAHKAIAQGKWQAAERELLAQRDRFADRPELALNLAAVYVATGRAAEALALYRQVQAQPNVAMDMPDGRIVGSHAIASRGMERVAPVMAIR